MVGIFDSGMGGELAVRYLRRYRPDADIAFLADRKNAPYGKKSRDELISLVTRDIDALRGFGAEEILMACCTASTVYDYLPEKYKQGVIPIIRATATTAVQLSENLRIGIIATDATVSSGAFEWEISKLCPHAEVIAHSSGALVDAVERNGTADDKMLDNELSFLDGTGIRTLILGCTHFAALEEKIRKRGYLTVNSARIGAEMISHRAPRGRGSTLYINK